jgi:hypothetical protein
MHFRCGESHGARLIWRILSDASGPASCDPVAALPLKPMPAESISTPFRREHTHVTQMQSLRDKHSRKARTLLGRLPQTHRARSSKRRSSTSIKSPSHGPRGHSCHVPSIDTTPISTIHSPACVSVFMYLITGYADSRSVLLGLLFPFDCEGLFRLYRWRLLQRWEGRRISAVGDVDQ